MVPDKTSSLYSIELLPTLLGGLAIEISKINSWCSGESSLSLRLSLCQIM